MKKCITIFAVVMLITGGAFAAESINLSARAPEGYSGGPYDRSVCDVTCPSNAIPENEPVCYDNYRDSTNTGCNCYDWSPPTICTFSDIVCGDIVCGTSGNFNVTDASGVITDFRDTDWYRLVLTTPSIIYWSAYTEFPVQLVIISAGTVNCYDQALNYATGGPCQVVSDTSSCLPAGTYYLWIGPSVFDGLPCGLDYYAWVNCQPCSYCDPTETVRFFPGESIDCQCIDLCEGVTTTVVVCGASSFPPVVQVRPGCYNSDQTVEGCTEECPPATFYYNAQNWLFNPTIGCWVNYIQGLTSGCACVCFDRWLPVEMLGFDAVAGNASVTLRWRTASENNTDHFEISRNGTYIASVSAAGTSTAIHTYSHVDHSVENGISYTYALRSVDINGASQEHGTVNATPEDRSAQVWEYTLYQNYPNPFNPSTSIAFDLPEAAFVTLTVYNVTGQEVVTLVSEPMNAGKHSVNFDGGTLASGVYLYRLTAGSFTADRRMLLMK
jgi:hypothetical protein